MAVMASANNSVIRKQLESVVQSIQWTYAIFWQLSNQQGVLEWSEGYYNGDIKTRKTVQPMELSNEELCLQRTLQLRELYESLSAGESNQPARRPCAALSPEDLTDTEWYYLVCMSYTFAPGVGLPGRTLANGRLIWLCQANEADSKVFPRALLAKSASIQTVVCIPLADGVLEFGTTEVEREDPGLVQRTISFFFGVPQTDMFRAIYIQPTVLRQRRKGSSGHGHNNVLRQHCMPSSESDWSFYYYRLWTVPANFS